MGTIDATQQLRSFVLDGDHPCLAARSVFHRDAVAVVECGDLADAPAAAARVAIELRRFAARPAPAKGFASFITAFSGTVPADEATFEAQLWALLRGVHGHDDAAWTSRASSDPADEAFGFSFAGEAWFVVGLHPAASRLARQAPVASLVFNRHAQFDELRATGRYERLRDTIRTRDRALQGSINPMASDYGTVSEARQYAGRAVAADWIPPLPTCPFGPEVAE